LFLVFFAFAYSVGYIVLKRYEILVAVNIQTQNNDDVSNQLARVHKSDARVILMYATK
jgi:hypothetical protein